MVLDGVISAPCFIIKSLTFSGYAEAYDNNAGIYFIASLSSENNPPFLPIVCFVWPPVTDGSSSQKYWSSSFLLKYNLFSLGLSKYACNKSLLINCIAYFEDFHHFVSNSPNIIKTFLGSFTSISSFILLASSPVMKSSFPNISSNSLIFRVNAFCWLSLPVDQLPICWARASLSSQFFQS